MTTYQKSLSRIGIGLAIVLGFSARAFAAAGTLTPSAYQTVTTASGAPISGACVWTYVAGTTTPVATYTDKALTTPNANPIVTDSSGQFVAWLTPGSSYKYLFETACTAPAHGTTLRTVDNIDAVPTSSATVDEVGVAGEALTAGNCAYLSDGSGSKTAGQWFKCDSTNTYSSTTPQTGLVLATVSATASVTVRSSGSLTGLSALAVGSKYYISTAGTLTTTAPANVRFIGQADTATSIVLATNPPGTNTISVVDDFRLGAATATCAPVADITAATSVFFTPCYGNRFTVADAAGNLSVLTSAEISIAVPATTVTMYDVWAYSNAGVLTLELTAWTNDTTRATGITRTTTGFYTKSGDLTRRYVASIRTTGVSGQTEDSFTKRFVWNFYNRLPRTLKVFEATDTWVYSTAAYRQARATATNQVECVIGVADVEAQIVLVAMSRNDTASDNTFISISDAATTVSTTPDTSVTGQAVLSFAGATTVAPGQAILRKYPVVGHHVFGWLEQGSGANTTTWYGDNGAAAKFQSGMLGTIPG